MVIANFFNHLKNILTRIINTQNKKHAFTVKFPYTLNWIQKRRDILENTNSKSTTRLMVPIWR